MLAESEGGGCVCGRSARKRRQGDLWPYVPKTRPPIPTDMALEEGVWAQQLDALRPREQEESESEREEERFSAR